MKYRTLTDSDYVHRLMRIIHLLSGSDMAKHLIRCVQKAFVVFTVSSIIIWNII